MKKINFIICLCISAILVSCGDDNSDDRLLITNANLQGTYQMGAFNQTIDESATSSSGATVNLSSTTSVGDIYNLDIIINENGTYSASGQYTFDFVTTPNGSAQVTGSTIVDVEVLGNFTINSLENTITFIDSTSIEDEFLSGTYNIVLLNSNTLSLVQEIEISNGSLNNATKTSFSFIK
ncbi:hypothetical protein [Polaribacter sp. Hel_I_88]|uniref:hypothetical protein n=1 Tax=Polaribacter sp. Hel_I_88 TaxID=1250006 RepID=UPI00047C1DBF|nr:hypothetical protein [Polaribacter sp. Hel_I_88]